MSEPIRCFTCGRLRCETCSGTGNASNFRPVSYATCPDCQDGWREAELKCPECPEAISEAECPACLRYKDDIRRGTDPDVLCPKCKEEKP